MKKLLLLLLLFTTIANAADVVKFRLAQNQKLEGTFSGDLDKKESIHFVIAKNTDTKKFDMLSFFMDASGNIKELEKISFKKVPSILSYHKTGNTLTVLNYNDNELRIIDFDILSLKATINKINDFKQPGNVFRLNNKTVLFSIRPAKVKWI